MLSEGFGLLHAVGKGSTHPPVVITLTYHGTDKNEAPIALVGKGITYDSVAIASNLKWVCKQ